MTQTDRMEHVRQLTARVKYKNWNHRVAVMGDGCYLQVMLDALDDKGDNWTGRKWYISNFATDSEIISTHFKAILTAEEHETREQFLFDGAAIYGPHQSLEALVANANGIAPDARSFVFGFSKIISPEGPAQQKGIYDARDRTLAERTDTSG